MVPIPEVRAELSLESSGALETVDALGTGLDGVVTEFQTSFETAISTLSGDIAAATGEVRVDADVSPAQEQVATAVTNIDATSTAFEVDADTTAAEENVQALAGNVEDLGVSSEDTGGKVSGLSGNTGALSAVASASSGDVSKLTSGLGTMGVGLTAVAGAAGGFFTAAVSSESATIRLRNAAGDLASQIENIRIGNLSTSISELGSTLGSSSAQMRNTAADVFLFATNAGVGRQASATLSQEILALGARAVALDPSLGSVADTSDRLFNAFRSGRDKALNPFNLGLSKTEIQSKATEIALAAGRTEVTAIDKAMAGAELATAKFGGTLQQTIAEGAKNPTIQLQALKQELLTTAAQLGKPLTAPIFELLHTGAPIAAEAAKIVALLAASALPALTASLAGITPLLTIATHLLEAIPAPVTASFLAFQLLARTVSINAGVIGAIIPLLAAIDPGLASAAVSVGSFAFAGAQAARILPNVSTGMGVAAGVGAGLGQVIGGTAGNMLSFASSGALLGQALIPIPVVGAAAGAGIGALAGALLGGGQSAEKAHEEITKLAQALEGLTAAQAAKRFLDEEVDTFGLLASAADKSTDANTNWVSGQGEAASASQRHGASLKDLNKDFRDLAQTSPAAAAAVLAGLQAKAADGDAAARAALQNGNLQRILDEGSAAYAKHAQGAQADRAANEALAAATTAAGFATALHTEQQKTATQVAQAAVGAATALVAAGRANAESVQGQATAYATASAAAANYKTAQDILNSSTLSLAQAQQQSESSIQSLAAAVEGGATDFDVHTAAGNKNFAMLISATSGAQNYATALVAAGHSQQEADASLQGFTGSIIGMLSQANVAPPVIGAMLTQLGLAPNVIDPAARSLYGLTPAVGAATGAISTLGPATSQATSASVEDIAAWAAYGVTVIPQTGQDAAAGFKTGIDQLPGGTAGATEGASAVARGWGIISDFGIQGQVSGGAFVNALINALNDGLGRAEDAGRALGRFAARGAANAGSPTEHLFYDSGASFADALAGGMLDKMTVLSAAGQGLARAAVASPANPGAGSSVAAMGTGAGPSQTNNFYGYSPAETAAVNGREWTRMTRFAGV